MYTHFIHSFIYIYLYVCVYIYIYIYNCFLTPGSPNAWLSPRIQHCFLFGKDTLCVHLPDVSGRRTTNHMTQAPPHSTVPFPPPPIQTIQSFLWTLCKYIENIEIVRALFSTSLTTTISQFTWRFTRRFTSRCVRDVWIDGWILRCVLGKLIFSNAEIMC